MTGDRAEHAYAVGEYVVSGNTALLDVVEFSKPEYWVTSWRTVLGTLFRHVALSKVRSRLSDLVAFEFIGELDL